MIKESVSLPLNADILKKIDMVVERNGQNKVDFVNELLDGALNNYMLVQTGGLVLTVPNPQFYHIDKEKAAASIEEIVKVSMVCTSSNIPNGLIAFSEYLKARIFADSEEHKDFFKSNLEMRTCAEKHTI